MFQATYYRTIWISDVHLGTRACKAGALLDFLRHHMAETLYLVGDIVDGWNWGPAWHWSAEQQELVDEIVRWRHAGVKVVFLPGNHDESKLDLVKELFGSLPYDKFSDPQNRRRREDARDPWASVRWIAQSKSSAAEIWIAGYARAQWIHDWYNRQPERCEDGRSLAELSAVSRPQGHRVSHRLPRSRGTCSRPRPQGRRRNLRTHSSLGSSAYRKRHVCERRRLGAEPDGVGRGAGEGRCKSSDGTTRGGRFRSTEPMSQEAAW